MSAVTTTSPGPARSALVGLVRTLGHEDDLDERMRRGAQPAVADEEGAHPQPFGGTDAFVLHRAGVGIDVKAHA
jgi:hypothetical protein